jgi:hypothetical protein
VAAYRAAGDPTNPEELTRWAMLRSGEGENAVPVLRAAGARLKTASAAWKAGMDAMQRTPLTGEQVAALEAMVAEGAEALAALDEAAARSRIDWEPRFASPMMAGNLVPAELAEQRGLVTLAWAAALVAHQRGDDAEALRRVGQILFVARALDHQPGLIHHLVALGCNAAAARAAADLAPGLHAGAEAGAASPGQVRELVATLLDERPLADGQRRAWVAERVMQLDVPNAIGRGGAGAGTFGGVNVQIPGARFVVRPWAADNARVMVRATTAILRTMGASADLPAYHAAMAANNPAPELARSPRRYAMAGVLIPSFGRAVEQHYRCVADRRLAAVCLAARLYALDHGGQFPARLDDLAPAYLPAVPADPLAAGGAPLRYVNDPADPRGPRVYSVGPDGADDGATELPEEESARRAARAKGWDEVRYLKPGRTTRPATRPG